MAVENQDQETGRGVQRRLTTELKVSKSAEGQEVGLWGQELVQEARGWGLWQPEVAREQVQDGQGVSSTYVMSSCIH